MNDMSADSGGPVVVDGWFIRHRRLDLGMTQQDLATAIAVDRSRISQIERRRRSSVKADTAERLVQALQTTTEDLISGGQFSSGDRADATAGAPLSSFEQELEYDDLERMLTLVRELARLVEDMIARRGRGSA